MIKDLLTFKLGGIHPDSHKTMTSQLAIEDMPAVSEIAVSLAQHIGAPCTASVKKGDTVTEGQIVGETLKGLGSFAHTPCKGKVKKIASVGNPVRLHVPAVIIETEDEAPKTYTHRDWTSFTPAQMLDMIHHAGVIGAGGAGFPTHAKLQPPKDMPIDVLIINGAECEPYLTADHRVMLEMTDKVIEGIRIAARILGVSQCIVGIEDNKPDAVAAMKAEAEKASDVHIKIQALRTKYPQGSEKQLVYALTGKTIGAGALPASVGAVVCNISTAAAVCDAVAWDKPMIERILTVSGKGIKRPANLRCKVGTRLRDIIHFLGGTAPDLKKIILGGPMMGFACADLDIPVTKTTSGILFLTSEEVDLHKGGPCIRCGWCLEACPMGLEPKEIALFVEAGRGKETAQFGAMECFECGSCAYTCPSKRPLVQLIRLAKQAIKTASS